MPLLAGLGAAGTAALIGAAGSAASTGISAGLSAGRTKRARRWQEGQINKERQWQLEDRTHMEQYQSYENQMKLLEDAGLNPHLIYGTGTRGAGGSQNISAPHTPQVGQQKGEKLDLNTLQNMLMMKQIQQKDADIGLTKEQTNALTTKNKYLDQQLTQGLTKLKEQIDFISQTTTNNKTRNQLDKITLGIEKELQQLKIESGQRELGDYIEYGVNKQDAWKVKAVATILRSLGVDKSVITKMLTGEVPW